MDLKQHLISFETALNQLNMATKMQSNAVSEALPNVEESLSKLAKFIEEKNNKNVDLVSEDKREETRELIHKISLQLDLLVKNSFLGMRIMEDFSKYVNGIWKN